MANEFAQFRGASPAPASTTESSNEFSQFRTSNTVEPQTTFGQRTGETIAGAIDASAEELSKEALMDTSNIRPDIMETFGTPKQSAMETTQGILSEGLGAASNILIDGGLTLLDSIVPENVQEYVSNFSRGAWERISESPTIQEGLRLLGEGGAAYGEWAKANPDAADRLSEVVTIAPGMRVGSRAEAAAKVRAAGYRQRLKNRKQNVDEMMEPANRKGDGRLEVDNKGNQYYEPSKWEAERNREVLTVPEVNPAKSAAYNRNMVENQATKYRTELDKLIDAKGNPEIDKAALHKKITTKINNLDTDDLLSGDAEKHAITIYNQAMKRFNESDGTAKGLLDARRDLDRWISKQRQGVFVADREDAIRVANKLIRDSLNEGVEEAVGPQVRMLLDKQHKLLSAADVLDAKTYKQANTWVGRLKQKVENKLGMKFPTTPLAAGATVATGVSLMVQFPVVGAAIAGAGGMVGLVSALRGPKAKAVMAELLELADRVPVARPEINALIQLGQEMGPEEETE